MKFLSAVVVSCLVSVVALAQKPALTPAEPRGVLEPTGTLGPDVYKKRRAQLMSVLGKAVTIVTDEMRFDGLREGMDFYWLTGFNEPGAVLLLDPTAPIYKEVLFLTPKKLEEERWSGERAALPSEAMVRSTGIGRVVRTTALQSWLLQACDRAGEVAFVGEFNAADGPIGHDQDLLKKVSERHLTCKLKDLHHAISRLRVVKSPAEIALIRRAIAVTAEGFKAAMREVRAGQREYAIKDAAEAAMRKAGARHLAYDSITGSGPNGAVLHYPKDDRVMRNGELVVADIGAEIEMYASDITRTLPVGGTFTAEQRAVYEAVLKAQNAGIAKAKPGVTMAEIQKVVSDSILASGYFDAYPHGCCHFVGLEVHDVGEVETPLPEGAVFTVEPGIYLPEKGFGVRIEDDVLLVKGGVEVLSKDMPRGADDIEKLMRAD